MVDFVAPWSELKGPAVAEGWLRWHPSRLNECVAARADALPAPLGPAELAELERWQQRWGGDEATLASVACLGQPQTRVVITGQQPGLLAGPLLVLYKAAAAVRLARELKKRHDGLKFVPVFWVASEDHDFNEVRRAWWPGQAGLEEVILQPEVSSPGRMVGLIQSGEFTDGLVASIENSTLRTEFRDEVLALVREAYGSQGATLEDGFCRLLLRLLKGTGLVVVSPLMDWVRRRGAPVLAHELEQAGRTSLAVRERGEAMRAAGLEPAIHRHNGALNMFWIDDDGRRWALREGEGSDYRKVLAETGEELPPASLSQLAAELQANPRRFSPNVVTRPLVQDLALPTVAQVVGPGEAAYLAQVEPIYADFGVFAPLRWPRPEVVLIEPRVERRLRKQGLVVEEALGLDAEALLEVVMRRGAGRDGVQPIEELAARQRAELAEIYQRLGPEAGALRGSFDRLDRAIERGWRSIEEQLLSLRSQDQEQLRAAMSVVASSLYPAGLPQERALNPVAPMAIHYGPDWGLLLLERLEIEPGRGLQSIILAELVAQP